MFLQFFKVQTFKCRRLWFLFLLQYFNFLLPNCMLVRKEILIVSNWLHSLQIITNFVMCYFSFTSSRLHYRIEPVWLSFRNFGKFIVKSNERILNGCCGSHNWLFFLLKITFFSVKWMHETGIWRLNRRRFWPFLADNILFILAERRCFLRGVNYLLSIYW